MILVDSNIPIYLVGAPHANKDEARRRLERAIRGERRLVTDAEVLQEILHRYAAIDRRDAIQPAFDALLGIVDVVYPVEVTDVEMAKTLLHGRHRMSARDVLHLAIMRRHRIEEILTFDRAFDDVAGIRRFGG